MRFLYIGEKNARKNVHTFFILNMILFIIEKLYKYKEEENFRFSSFFVFKRGAIFMTYEEYLEHLNNLDTFAKIFLFDSTKKSLNLIYQSIKNNKEFESAVSSLELLNACSYMLNDQVGFIDESQNNISKTIKKERNKMKDELKVKVNVVKLENENSKLKALATVIIGSKDLDYIKISNVRLYEPDYLFKRENSYFVALPEKEYETDGEKRYIELVTFSNKFNKELPEIMKKTISSAVISAYKEEGKVTKFEKETKIPFDPTNVNAYISENKKGSIFFGGIMQINNIFLNEGKDNNMYLSLPSREIEKDGEKKYEDIIAPLSKELREAMTLACLESYKKNIIKSAEATEENTQSQENQEER